MGLGLSVRPTVKEMGPLAENWRLLHGGPRRICGGHTTEPRENAKAHLSRRYKADGDGPGEMNLTPSLH